MRLKGFDYNNQGAYFLTICTHNRKQILSRIVGGVVPDAPCVTELLFCGRIADKYIKQLNSFYDDIEVISYVIMPNHIHLLLFIKNPESSELLPNGASRTPPPTAQHSKVSRFVSTFKRYCNKEYGSNIWQRYYYDHIIRSVDDYGEHLQYIYENPIRWKFDKLYSKE